LRSDAFDLCMDRHRIPLFADGEGDVVLDRMDRRGRGVEEEE
jgi:hypothetical protein